jgi:outer membrane receptor protein involved in Fe transport
MGLALLAVAPAHASAQATGSITGIVTDQSGAVLPGATVEATSDATGQVREAFTAADGVYTIPLLTPGRYQVRATLQGFRTTLRSEVQVRVTESTRVDLSLAVGDLAETITVTGEAPLVETTNTTLGIVVDQQKVVDLPLIGRNFTQLGTLIPGVVAPPTSLGGQRGDATPGGFGNVTGGFSVNGMRNQSNNFLLDGTTNNDTFNTGFVLRPPPDAIEEFKILTHSYSAEYGRNAGSVVNVVTKSGSNEWHGAAWEFNRDDSLQSRNFFAPANQPKPKLRQNQFGGAGGGPLVRGKLFTFGWYEGYRNTQGTTTNFVVLTEAQRQGNFAGGAAIRDPQTGLPFPGNVIPANRISPVAQRFITDFVPLPNSGANRYIASPDVVDNRDQFGLKLDYQATSKHGFLGRYLRSETESVSPGFTRPIGTTSIATLQDFMGSHTYLISSNKINVARASFNRISANPAVTSGLLNADYGINVPHNVPIATGLANIAVTGFFAGLGDLQQPFVERKNEVFQFTDDFTWLTGQHQFKFGVDIRRETMKIAFVNRPNGDFTFSGVFTGNAAADFLLGLPAQFRRTTANSIQDGVGWLYAAYVQDEYRVSPRLTLNLGLRYELPLPFVDENDALNSFRPGQQSTRFPGAPTGLVYPGDAGVPRGTYETDKNNVAPRVGVNWDPTGTGRSSLRAAWGLFFDALAGQGDFFQNGVLAPPFTPLLEVNAPPAALTLADPLRAVAGGAAGFPPGLIFIGWGTDFSSPYAHHYNVSWQQQIGERFGAEVGYIGSRGFNLPIFIEVNPGLFTPGQARPSTRLFPAFSLVRPTFSVAKSWYDSLQASLRMRPWHGLNFLASYTLAHAQDHVSGLNIGGEQRPVLPVTIGDQASIDRALEFEKGDALFDVRHRFVVSFGWEIPGPSNGNRLAVHTLGGWQLNGIVQAQTGFPTTARDAVGTGIQFLTNRPDAVCDPNDNAPRTVAQWFNTSCIVRRTLTETGARPGNAGRNSIRGPGFGRTDLSLFKNFYLPGNQRIQFRIEAFNAFNQTRFDLPNVIAGTPTFGQITSADDGRIIQLALKYSF